MLAFFKRVVIGSLFLGIVTFVILFSTSALVVLFDDVGPAPATLAMWPGLTERVLPATAGAFVLGALAGVIYDLVYRMLR